MNLPVPIKLKKKKKKVGVDLTFVPYRMVSENLDNIRK